MSPTSSWLTRRHSHRPAIMSINAKKTRTKTKTTHLLSVFLHHQIRWQSKKMTDPLPHQTLFLFFKRVTDHFQKIMRKERLFCEVKKSKIEKPNSLFGSYPAGKRLHWTRQECALNSFWFGHASFVALELRSWEARMKRNQSESDNSKVSPMFWQLRIYL